MAKLELSNESLQVLEIVLKRCIKENKDMIRKCPSLISRLQTEIDELDKILKSLLVLPRLGRPYRVLITNEEGRRQEQNIVPESDRPRFNDWSR